jgi:hypothetical protein
LVAETANHRDAKRHAVIIAGMRSDTIPASTLVSVAIFANQEIVSNVRPAIAVHVIVLD